MSAVLGFDTSNYTTSAASFDGISGQNMGRLLSVPEGGLGLRQSDALFQHVKHLPGVVERLCLSKSIAAVGASTQPRAVEGSYMPCFLAGASLGMVLAQSHGVPFYPCSHQQGHIAAAAWSAGRMDLLDKPHLAWHLSGGTTELLYVEPMGVSVKAERIGGTTDIAAGQLIDRTGKRLGLPFPAGKAVDALAQTAGAEPGFRVKVKEMEFSLSGIENQMNHRVEQGVKPELICRFVLASVISAVEQATKYALVRFPGLPVLCAGGVASNVILRETMMEHCDALFAPAEFSTDNAMGVAILAWRAQKEGDLSCKNPCQFPP